MKKILTFVLALTLIMSLAACGGSEPEAAPAAPAAPAATPAAPAPAAPAKAAESKPDLKNPEYTPEQLAVAEKFAAMTDRFQALADTISADANLMAIPELIDGMNMMIDAVNADDALFADPKNLTAEVLKNLEEDIKIGNTSVDEIAAMIKTYQGKKAITVKVEIINSTGADLHGLAMSPTNDTEWGTNLLNEPLLDATSGVTEMTFTEDTLVWDLLAADAEGTTLTFTGIDFSQAPMEGAKLELVATEGGMFMATFVA